MSLSIAMFELFHFVTVKPGVDGIKPENITVFDFLSCGASERFSCDAAIASRLWRGANRFFRLTQWIETADVEWLTEMPGDAKEAGDESFRRIGSFSVFR
ncbi:hypothetical protein [Burkholderia sp. Tr-20390]|uniref:hypothetical protein n=1 Tax=Burkholderia sp. Tr-20390 TaxID=2703904 RepID=UPI001981942A|nr:hypothetical protein [Burkholderia sp. Tr-20390]MBN3736606.1 hypothetical protein [Burkholderia sp. Tr-20390]